MCKLLIQSVSALTEVGADGRLIEVALEVGLEQRHQLCSGEAERVGSGAVSHVQRGVSYLCNAPLIAPALSLVLTITGGLQSTLQCQQEAGYFVLAPPYGPQLHAAHPYLRQEETALPWLPGRLSLAPTTPSPATYRGHEAERQHSVAVTPSEHQDIDVRVAQVHERDRAKRPDRSRLAWVDGLMLCIQDAVAEALRDLPAVAQGSDR